MIPGWLKVNIPKKLDVSGLNTVCQEARCPNRHECFSKGTAAFLIMGKVCTRNCRYCNIESGKPLALDPHEPAKIASQVRKMRLRYAVITSVTRDDLDDMGAKHFAGTIEECKKYAKVEVLVPDFRSDPKLIDIVLGKKPDVFNHNIECTEKVFKKIRSGDYETSLRVLKYSSKKGFVTKSGLMVGLGEDKDDVIATLKDLKSSGVSILTIGQYLRPRKDLAEVSKFYTPDEFKEFKYIAEDIGFRHVFSGPLVRSSYHAASVLDDTMKTPEPNHQLNINQCQTPQKNNRKFLG